MAEDADAVDTATATTSPGSPTSGDPPPPPPDPGQHPSPPPSAVAAPVDAAPLPSPESPNLDVPLQIDEDASPPPSPPPRAPSPLFPPSWNRKRLADGSTLNGHGNPDREVDRDRHWDRDRDLNATKKGAEGETPSPTVDRRRSLEGREEQSEEEKIREYLGRSDTAVIYPEPVEPTKAPVAPDGEGEWPRFLLMGGIQLRQAGHDGRAGEPRLRSRSMDRFISKRLLKLVKKGLRRSAMLNVKYSYLASRRR